MFVFQSGIRPSARLAIGVAALIPFSLLLSGCEQHAAENKVLAQEKSSPRDSFPNDTALFLAGLKGRPDGPYRDLEQTEAWKNYSARFDRTWTKALRDQFAPVDAFQKRVLAKLHTGSAYLFYPFSGPDVLYQVHFFPDATRMVYAGLEPVGNLKRPEMYKTETLDRELGAWSEALQSIFRRSFFVTSEMDQDFRGQVSDGNAQIILLLLARSGDTVDEIQFGRLEPDGEFRVDDPGLKKHKVAKIEFHCGAETTERTLYYFSTDLSDSNKAHSAGFVEDPALEHFLEKQGTADTLVKSASFLLHWKMCDAIRGYILTHSNLILEDDSGIPYRFFKAPEWKVELFGQYSHPDPPFTSQWQTDLAKAFDEPGRAQQLGFQLGYGSLRRPSSLLLAVHSANTQAALDPPK
ncbi:MAG: hypothetical protein ABSH49_32925 [Bryobacteraceae bacterium]|jgi:hypothetical protein